MKVPGSQAPLAEAIKKSVGDKLKLITVGSITSGKAAEQILDDVEADIVMSGR